MLRVGVEIARQMRIATKDASDRTAMNIADEARRESSALTRDVDSLYLIVEALWQIVKKQNNLSDDHLGNLINEIDGRDGKVDGKKAKSVRPDCPQCGRKIIGQNQSCLWCGTVIKRELFSRN